MKQVSMRHQLTRASLLTTLIVLLVSAAAMLLYELATYRRAWVADMRSQADLVAQSTAAALVFDDRRAAQETISALRLQSRIRAAVIYDARGHPFATFSENPGEGLPAQISPELLQLGYRFDGAALEIAYPIEHDSERLGVLYLRARHDVSSRAANYAAILALVVAAGLALAIGVFARLQRRIAAPLVQMTDVAQQVMARRDWSLRAAETEYEDIGVLVRAFNGVLAECQARTGELEQQMLVRQHAERELRQADRRKDEFLATLAHELRNPLAPMTSAVALMQLDRAPETARRNALRIIERQLRQMVRLIDDLLDVSRLATGKLSLHRQPLDALAVLKIALELAEPVAQQKGVALHLDAASAAALPIEGDSARLGQVFSNLLNNACRYTPAGGRIDVTARADGDAVEIGFADTGIGVDPAMQGRIFDLFEQADKSLERGNTGLGIGLTLARQLVDLHGGGLSLYSAGLGEGSRFTVRLPRVAHRAADEAPAAGAAPAAGRPLRILIADDNVDFSASMAQLLQAHGHVVDVVADGEAAVAAIRAGRHDAGLLDVGMPGLNGYEVARQLRADAMTRDMLLVAITGWGQANDKSAARQAGFDRHLVKPVGHDEVMRVLSEVFPG